MDAIHDVIPVVGFTDDVAVIAAALAAIKVYAPEVAERKVEGTLKEWFDK